MVPSRRRAWSSERVRCQGVSASETKSVGSGDPGLRVCGGIDSAEAKGEER